VVLNCARKERSHLGRGDSALPCIEMKDNQFQIFTEAGFTVLNPSYFNAPF